MTRNPARDAEIVCRYEYTNESKRSIARSLGVTRGVVDRCLGRNAVEKRPKPPGWTEVEIRYLIILCNSGVTGQALIPFLPNHTYSSIKHQKDVLRGAREI
jgi:hypothetical protein